MVFAYFEGNKIWDLLTLKETKYGICLLWRKQNMVFAYFEGNKIWYLLTLKKNEIWYLLSLKKTKYGICLLWRKQNMISAYFKGNQILHLLTFRLLEPLARKLEPWNSLLHICASLLQQADTHILSEEKKQYFFQTNNKSFSLMPVATALRKLRWKSWTAFLVEVSGHKLESSQTLVFVWLFTLIFPFFKTLFMNRLEFSCFSDFFVCIFKTRVEFGFL